jgi:hypothetical protein
MKNIIKGPGATSAKKIIGGRGGMKGVKQGGRSMSGKGNRLIVSPAPKVTSMKGGY